MIRCALFSIKVKTMVILLSLSFALVKTEDDDLVDQIYHVISSPYLALVSEGVSWSASTKGACAILCMTQTDDCVSFYYEAYSGLCVPGTLTHKQDGHYVVNTAMRGFLYHKKNFCDESKSFYLALLNNAYTCLYKYLATPLSYREALDECRRRHSDFLTLKTPGQLRDLTRLRQNLYFWIGLDNRRTGNVFTWSDSKVTLTDSQRSSLFAAFQPDNSHGAGNSCCYYNPDWSKLDDTNCHEGKNVLCSKPIYS